MFLLFFLFFAKHKMLNRELFLFDILFLFLFKKLNKYDPIFPRPTIAILYNFFFS